MKKNKITLISSFATDRLFDQNNNFIREQKGGPAFFASNVFKKMKLPYYIIPSPKIVTEIILKDDNEFGKIGFYPALKIDYANIDTPYIFISPILNEFSLKNVDKYKGRIFLDAQGFTRNAGEFGKKKKWITKEETENSIFCLKVADYELPYLKKSFVKKQKKRILLLTQGTKGCTVYTFGKPFFVKPKRIVKSPDTLGAGDTFFAYFISQWIRTKDIYESASYAVDKTSDFLASKSHHNQPL